MRLICGLTSIVGWIIREGKDFLQYMESLNFLDFCDNFMMQETIIFLYSQIGISVLNLWSWSFNRTKSYEVYGPQDVIFEFEMRAHTHTHVCVCVKNMVGS